MVTLFSLQKRITQLLQSIGSTTFKHGGRANPLSIGKIGAYHVTRWWGNLMIFSVFAIHCDHTLFVLLMMLVCFLYRDNLGVGKSS